MIPSIAGSVYVHYEGQPHPIRVEFNKGDKIGDLKQRIARLTSIQANNQQLILNTSLLDNDYQVIDEKLYLELRKTPFITVQDRTSAIGKGQLSQKGGIEKEVEFEIKQINTPDTQKYEHTIHIKYRNQSESLSVGFNVGEKVNDLKQRIASQTNLPAKNQKLILNGAPLDNDDQVIDEKLYLELRETPFIYLQ